MSSEGPVARAEEIASRLAAEIDGCPTPEKLEELRVKYLGRKGALNQLLRGLKDLPPDDLHASAHD